MVLSNEYGVKTKGNAGSLTVNQVHDKGENTQRRPVNSSIYKIYQNRTVFTASFFTPDFLRPRVGEKHMRTTSTNKNKTGVIL